MAERLNGPEGNGVGEKSPEAVRMRRDERLASTRAFEAMKGLPPERQRVLLARIVELRKQYSRRMKPGDREALLQEVQAEIRAEGLVVEALEEDMREHKDSAPLTFHLGELEAVMQALIGQTPDAGHES